MKVAVYTLTRDRIDYTKICLPILREKAGVEFKHVVVDNGSEDGTLEWLAAEYKPDKLVGLPRNVGISKASNIALDIIKTNWPAVDVIAKVDNDCLVETSNVLYVLSAMVLDAAASNDQTLALSPRVRGINRQPHRAFTIQQAVWESVYTIGVTGIIGGLFHVFPSTFYHDYRYPADLPYAKGQDDHICATFRSLPKHLTGYVEDFVVNHFETTDGQAVRYPKYFERKWREEKEIPSNATA